MGSIRRLETRDGAARTAPGRRPRPGRIAVHMETTDGMVHVRVANARMPARIYLYVDGDLAETWVDVHASYDLETGEIAPGPHAVTARAVDVAGRWGGASAVVTVEERPERLEPSSGRPRAL